MNETVRNEMPAINPIRTFLKAQVSSFTGGVCDYLLMVAFTELAGFHYTLSILLSGAFGALINFTINRYWAFDYSRLNPAGHQLLRFVCVVGGSILLKSYGTFIFSSSLAVSYFLGRIVVDLAVSYGFNYPLMRYWVFRPREGSIGRG